MDTYWNIVYSAAYDHFFLEMDDKKKSGALTFGILLYLTYIENTIKRGAGWMMKIKKTGFSTWGTT